MPDTKDEFAEHCLLNAHKIFVRAKVNDKWGSYSLQQLDNEGREYWINRWWKEGRTPVMVSE